MRPRAPAELKIRNPRVLGEASAADGKRFLTRGSVVPSARVAVAQVHTFEGTLRPSTGADVPLDATQFVLRGSTLRNTKLALGVVAYTGRDTRLVRNARETPSKLSELERIVNNMVFFILGCMVAMTSASCITYPRRADPFLLRRSIGGADPSEDDAGAGRDADLSEETRRGAAAA